MRSSLTWSNLQNYRPHKQQRKVRKSVVTALMLLEGHHGIIILLQYLPVVSRMMRSGCTKTKSKTPAAAAAVNVVGCLSEEHEASEVSTRPVLTACRRVILTTAVSS